MSCVHQPLRDKNGQAIRVAIQGVATTDGKLAGAWLSKTHAAEAYVCVDCNCVYVPRDAIPEGVWDKHLLVPCSDCGAEAMEECDKSADASWYGPVHDARYHASLKRIREEVRSRNDPLPWLRVDHFGKCHDDPDPWKRRAR